MIFVFYFLASLLVYFSYKSFRGGINHLNFFKRQSANLLPDFTPFATVFAPCRGLDDGLKQNLESVLNQDYPAYEVIFVVDDENDRAVPLIREKTSNGVRDARLVIAPRTLESSQKVENLRKAVLHASDQSQVFVFVDSDARASTNWLRHLVAPLQDFSVGATTGYRWFISEKRSFPSELRSAWNASIASALGPNTNTNFCWGGSTAICRDTFEKLNIREKWRGTLSDDFTVTRAVNAAGLKIQFVPQAMVASLENTTFRGLLEFTTRQMKITRVYAPRLWKLSFFGSGLFSMVMMSAFPIIAFSETNGLNVLAAATAIILVTVFGFGKSYLRLQAARLVLPEYDEELRRQTFTQCILGLFTPAVFLYNCVAAGLSRRMKWRGITYELVSATETRVIHSSSSSATAASHKFPG